MRNLLIFMFLVGVFVLGSRSCNGFHWGFGGVKGTGPVQTEQRNISEAIHGIHLDLSAEVELVVGGGGTMEVSAQQNLLPLIKTSEESGILRIYSDDNYNSSEPIKIKIPLASLDEIAVGGSGLVKVGAFTADKLQISIGGSGEVQCVQATISQLQSSISGSGTLELNGKCTDWKADISGSGEIKAKAFTTNTLDASISGSGTITADVITDLKANVSGSGDVYYSGSPTVNSSVSGSGKVEKLKVQ
ncbi:MAG TPA: head GIN domain-containing protein [Saprospiraceae bacterium]|nr:head GIN domain-containing protein [Saprospiraceae bacterium]